MALNSKDTSVIEIPWYEVLHQVEPLRTALLTGGSRGIGAATKQLLEAHGWDVVAPTRSELDFADLNSVLVYMFGWLNSRQVPKYNAVVFCHGEWYSRSPWQPLKNDPSQSWYRQYTSRVLAPMFMLQYLLGGNPIWHPDQVVMVSSTRGLIGGVNTGPYAAACAAQIALMQGYAREYAGVRFNVVCPGLTDTEMGAQVRATGGCKPDAVPQSPESVASEIVRLIESEENGRVMRVVDGVATEAKWNW